MVRKLLAVKIHSPQGNRCYQSVVIAFMIKMLYAHEVARRFSSQVLTVTQHPGFRVASKMLKISSANLHSLLTFSTAFAGFIMKVSCGHNSQLLHNIKLCLIVFLYLLFSCSGKPEPLTSYLLYGQASYWICCFHLTGKRIREICPIFKYFSEKNYFIYQLSSYHIRGHFISFQTLSKNSLEFCSCSPLYVLNNAL